MESSLYKNYKRKFFVGLGILLALTCLALARYNMLLGIFGFIVTLTGMYAFSYMDRQEEAAREREIKEEALSLVSAEALEESPAAAAISLAFLQVDDYDEVFHSLPDEQRPLLVAAVDKFLREWAAAVEAYLHKTGRDSYTLLLPLQELEALEQKEFSLLDEVRKINVGDHPPVTLSIGAARGVDAGNPARLGQLARQALNLAIERGGDQAVVKSPEHTWFYGGRTEAVGKRSQVRARVTAAELDRLLKMAKNVVLMGHVGMDFDALGAALGLAEIARHYGKPAKIVVDRQGGAVERLFSLVAGHNPELLCEKEEAVEITSPQTLMILVDVHRPQMVISPKLLSRAGSIVVIDHHRRGEEFPEHVKLSYIVPAASSTCELVGELAHYFPEEIHFSSLAATAMLAGLVVDTKRFTFGTSSRTFRVAAWLREAGAAPAVIRELFTDTLEVMLYRARILQSVEIVGGKYAVAGNDEPFAGAQVAASRAADNLLEIAGVTASFVLYPVEGGMRISARSTGAVNVHRVMEKLGGGGHFTVAAAFLPDVGMEEARGRLLNILNAELEEGR